VRFFFLRAEGGGPPALAPFADDFAGSASFFPTRASAFSGELPDAPAVAAAGVGAVVPAVAGVGAGPTLRRMISPCTIVQQFVVIQ
jgi:hypothetical protein